MKNLSILLAILLTFCMALSALPVEKVTAQSPPTLAPPELYAGSSNPGRVYQYGGDNSWDLIATDQELGDAYAVTSLVKYQGQLYAGVTTGYGGYSGVGRVYVRDHDEDTSWTLVGDNMDHAVISLAAYKGDLYAGTGRGVFRLYKYTPGETDCGIENWTRVANGSWDGVRSLYVSCVSGEYLLLMGDALLDRFGHWDGSTFKEDEAYGGSCIYDYQDYGDYVYASAYQGRLWRSSDREHWDVVLGYYGGNMWQLEAFQDELYMTYNNGELRVWDGSGDPRGTQVDIDPSTPEVDQAPDGIISMTTDGGNLYFGTGGDAVGYGCESTGIANIYECDGTNTELISDYDQFGAGVQVLYSPEKLVVGYMWQNLSVLEGKRLTHVIESFALVDSRVQGFLDTDYYHLNKDTFVQEAEAKNMVPLVSIARVGKDDPHWADAISEDNRDELISSIIDLIAEAGYMGVDIDLEGLAKKDVEDYRHFVQELRESLDADPRTNSPRRLLTVTVQGYALHEGYYSIGSIRDDADYIMVMGYHFEKYKDPSGAWDQEEGGKLGYTVKRLLNEIVAMGYPAEQVIYLLPFYTRWSKGDLAWSTLVEKNDNRQEITDTVMDEDYLEKLVRAKVSEKKHKDVYEEVWVTDPDCIRAKVRAALFENNISLPDGSSGNIGGVGAWQIGQDSSDSELTEALWDAAHGV